MPLVLPKAASLLAEKAVTAIGDILSPHREPIADSLTPARLGALMRDADRGDMRAYLTLAEEMEEREPHYASVLATRKLGVSGAVPTVIAPSDQPDDLAITEDLEQLVADPQFEGLVLDCMDAIAKGFAMVEILWQRDARHWHPLRYEFREQRHFQFDRDTLKRPLLRTMRDYMRGEELEPFKWIQHYPRLKSGVPIRGGLARTVAVTYAAKRWTIADWLAFLDIYGMPIRIGRYPLHMKDQKRELLRVIKSIGVDAAAVVPKDMDVELIETKVGAGGTTLYQQSAEYWDKQTSKVVLGQTMTSDDGASLAQSKTHERVRFDIRDADARAVAATITRDLFRPYVILNYGERPTYPALKLHTQQPEDVAALMNATRVFVNLGGKVQMSEVRDRLGLAEPEEGAELLEPESVINARAKPKTPQPSPGVPPGTPPTPGPDEDEGEPGQDDGAPPTPAQDPRELNRAGSRERLADKQGIDDVVDELAELALDDWQPLAVPVVDELFRQLEACTSFAQAKALIESMRGDVGEIINLDKLVASLARETYRARGIGDATDKTEGI